MTLPGHHDAVTCLQFDDTRIVSGSLDCNLKFWDVHTGACNNTIDWKASEGHTGVVRYGHIDPFLSTMVLINIASISHCNGSSGFKSVKTFSKIK